MSSLVWWDTGPCRTCCSTCGRMKLQHMRIADACGHDDCRYTCSCVHHKPSRLLQQSPDWRSEEDDRQVATCLQLGSTNRLEYAQVRPGTHSFPAKSATLAGRCRPGSVQSLRPGVQMSALLRWLLNTCRPTANPSPAFLVVVTCDRLTVVISTSHV